MTAEIAIMNKSAVALAADSAVTIESGTGLKVFRTINKLFTLSKYYPVGVMIFGGAALNGMPWETIVKAYRQELGNKGFPTIQDYATHFFEYLNGARNLFPADQQERTFTSILTREVAEIRRRIDENVRQRFVSAGQITEAEVKTIVSTAIRSRYDRWRAAKTLPGLPQGYADAIRDAYKDTIKQVSAQGLEKLPLTRTDRRRLAALPLLCATKDLFSGSQSGIVIAGFGQDELMPRLVNYAVDYVVGDRVKHRLSSEVEIDHDNTATIIPFAQSEMVATFMEGIDPQLREVLERYVKKLFEDVTNLVLGQIGASSVLSGSVGTLGTDLQKLVETATESFEELMGERARVHVRPILDTVAVLPKDELAAMAEAMVNLTSFKRRVSLDEVETVGGDIDVAVISKGDGFVWIKRKHYFDLQRNPLWLQNYYK